MHRLLTALWSLGLCQSTLTENWWKSEQDFYCHCTRPFFPDAHTKKKSGLATRDYPVGWSTNWFIIYFAWIINCNFNAVIWIRIKIGTDYCLCIPCKCAKIQPDQIMSSKVMAIFFVCVKKKWKFSHSYLKNDLCNFLQIWYVAFLGRQAPPQQIWHSSDKRSWSYECVKIATLVFLSIYLSSYIVCTPLPVFLGHTTHYRVSW